MAIMHRPTHRPTGSKPRLAEDLNALVLYALLLGVFSIHIIGALTAPLASNGRTDADSASTPATYTSGRGP